MGNRRNNKTGQTFFGKYLYIDAVVSRYTNRQRPQNIHGKTRFMGLSIDRPPGGICKLIKKLTKDSIEVTGSKGGLSKGGIIHDNEKNI